MNRRFFVRQLSLGAMAMYASPLFAEAAKQRSLGLQLYTVRDAVAKDLEGTLTKLANLGFGKLEIFGYNGSFFGKSAKDFKKILDNTGFSVISSHHTSGLKMKGKGTLTDGWDKAIEDIHTLGAKYMVCAYLFPNERTDDIYKSLPDLLNKSGEATKKSGIQFGYHNHDFEFDKFGDSTAFDFLIQNTSSDLVKIELDLYWINKAGQDPIKYFDKYPGRFELWHVKDMAPGNKEITEIGHGTIDFDRIFAARKKAGMKYWFVEQDISKGDMFESLKFSTQTLAKKNY